MAELLSINPRSYAYLTRGEILCSALTLVLFLLYCCADYTSFLEGLRSAFQQARDEQ